MPTHTRLKGVAEISDSLLNDQLEENLSAFFNWGTLCVGGFSNVTIPTSGAYGGNTHRLALVKDPRYTDGQVWQSHRQNWVYESGVEYGTQPINISGVFVNNTFMPVSGNQYYINYPLGQVVFNSAIAQSATVQLEYSYKYINFLKSDNPVFKEIQANSYRPDDRQFALKASGDYAVFGENRVQLPAVFIEALPSRAFKGHQLGGGQYVYQDMALHIITDTPWDRKQIVDLISFQNEKTIQLFDKNRMKAANAFPLDYHGMLQSGAKTYPTLVEPSGNGGYEWRLNTLTNTKVGPVRMTNGLYAAVVRTTCEVVMPEI